MLKTLVKISNKLDSLGLTREADLLDQILRKLAVPIEDIVEMRKDEPLGYELSRGKYLSSGPASRLERKRNVLRDIRGRETLKSQMEQSELPLAEQEAAELGEWYGSLKELGDSIILIPFDRSQISKNKKTLLGLAAIFEVGASLSYKKLYSKINLFSGSENRKGDLQILKEIFPSLWMEISDILKSKKLDEKNVIYMFYNQENSPERGLFTRNPFYLAHDLGHSIFDSLDGKKRFIRILDNFLMKVLDLYISDDPYISDEDNKTLLEAIEESKVIDTFTSEIYLAKFFPAVSDVDDIYGDIFAYATSGKLESQKINIPYSINLEGTEYKINSDSRDKISNLIKECINNIKNYINPNVDQGTFAPGPLAHLTGFVVFQDL